MRKKDPNEENGKPGRAAEQPKIADGTGSQPDEVGRKLPEFLAAPDYIRAEAKGLQNVEVADLIVPRIKLLQALSPEVLEFGLRPGVMIDSITKEELGAELRLVFLDHNKSRRLFEDVDRGGGLLCMSTDGLTNLQGLKCLTECPWPHRHNPEAMAHQWNEKAAKGARERKPTCVYFYDFPAVMFRKTDEGVEPVMIAFSCSSSKITTAKRILTTLSRKIDARGQAYNIYATAWQVTSRQQTSGTFKFFNFDARPMGFPTREEYLLAEKMAADLARQRYEIHHDETETEEDADGGETAGADQATKF